MPQRRCEIKGAQGFNYQGLNRSEDRRFTLNGLDVYQEVVDGNGTNFGASVEFVTNLKKVYAAKVIKISDETGDAIAVSFTFNGKGSVSVAGLDALANTDVVVFVAVGTKV